MIFKKSNMQYDDYSKTATNGDNPDITGEPDSTLFNRHEKYEVLDLINSLDLETLDLAKKAETLIHDELPSDIRSRKAVKDWIKKKLS